MWAFCMQIANSGGIVFVVIEVGECRFFCRMNRMRSAPMVSMMITDRHFRALLPQHQMIIFKFLQRCKWKTMLAIHGPKILYCGTTCAVYLGEVRMFGEHVHGQVLATLAAKKLTVQ